MLLSSFLKAGITRAIFHVDGNMPFCNEKCQNLDERLPTILIFCDISKAFDRVWHAGLFKKLISYGISGDLLIWFTNYISGRRQFMFVDNELSDYGIVKGGVLQRSVLGPLLFMYSPVSISYKCYTQMFMIINKFN
jgi:hypothetical protein